MDLNRLSVEAYQTAKEKGWHDKEQSDEELLMLVITELSEAVQADRKGKRADKAMFINRVQLYGCFDNGLKYISKTP